MLRAQFIAALAASVIAQTKGAPVPTDPRASTITVYVYKKGLFSFMADDHVIEAPIARGTYDSASQSVDVEVDAAALKVLDPKLSADTRSQVQSSMLGPKVLDAEQYPKITFRSTKIEQTARNLKIAGDLSLHGQTHPVSVTAEQVDATHFMGSATIRQTDFGIAPIKVAGGAVSVRDDVKIEFRIALGS
jgi:polyisoprenoid-binding protein YceI